MKRVLGWSCLCAWLLVLCGVGCGGGEGTKDAKDIVIKPVVTQKGKKDVMGMGKEADDPMPQLPKKGG